MGSLLSYILLITLNRSGKYAACILGGFFTIAFYPPYWSWRAGYLSGATGASFAMGLQSSISNISSVLGPQYFQAKWQYNGYRNSFVICMCMVASGFLWTVYAWWLTRRVESQVLKVRREILRARREGREYTGENDIDILGDETLKNRRLW